MLTGILAVAAIAVGLPLLAWWVGGRRMWSRLRPGAPADPWREFVRRHHLSGGEAAMVAAGIVRGERFTDTRLRRAAADWARDTLDRENLSHKPWLRGTLLVLIGLLALGLVISTGVALVQGRAGDVHWPTLLIWIALGISAVRRRRNLRRAVELNSGPADVPDPHV